MFPWYLIFLKRSLVFAILLFSSISLHWSLRKHFLSLLAILWMSAFKWVYLSFSPLSLASLLFLDIYKASSDSHFAFLHFLFLGMVLIPASCTMSQTSVHSSSSILSVDWIPWSYLSLPLYLIWFRSFQNCLVVFLSFLNLNLNLAIRSSWSEPQPTPGLEDLLELTPPQKSHFHHRGLEYKSRKSRNTWCNKHIWPWSMEWSRAKANRVLPREHTGHSKYPLPTTQEKTLHMDITIWSTLKSDWLYSLQPKMKKLYTVSKNKTRSWWWLRSWTAYCQIQT